MLNVKELDIQSRAAASLVEEWQAPDKVIRAVWKLEDLIKLLVHAADIANDVRNGMANRNGEADEQLAASAAYVLASLMRLKKAADGALHVIEMFDSQGYSIDGSTELRQCVEALPGVIADAEAFAEALEWKQLEQTAISSDRIRAVAEYLNSTGQASA